MLDKTKQQQIADYFKKYRLKAMLLQELNMKNEGILNLKSTDGDQYHITREIKLDQSMELELESNEVIK